MPSILLRSCDDMDFSVDTEIAKRSVTIKDMLENLGIEEDSDTPVPIMNVRGEVLERVIEWCDHHREDPVTPEGQEPSKDNKNIDLTEWDAKFTGVHNKEIDQDTLNDILLAANFLEIQELLLTCCKAIAQKIKMLSVEEIRREFNIRNDYTKEEEEQVRRENEWCMDR